jgi:TRAP-type mannitol/chloroaromatic compound transport system permease small subunit
MAGFERLIDRVVGAIARSVMVLVLPLALLLFLQWPLREVVQAYSREANDLAQCLFALYVSVAITYATRRRAHLATDVLAQRFAPRVRRILDRVAALAVLVPWSAFMLAAAWPSVAQSVRQFEAFPETFNPGYFVLKIALWLLALLVLAQALANATLPGSLSPDE